LLVEMLEAAGHTDELLVHDLLHGFAVIGEMDAGGQGVAVEGGKRSHGKPARFEVPDLGELKAACEAINRQTIAHAAPDENAAAVWAKTKEEERKGLISQLQPLEAVDLKEVLLVRRFGVCQWGASGWKVRPIDDFLHNFANSFSVA